ncbi:hypothetical protein ACFQU9_39385 [Actinomadura namibiensis]|uniref:Uncharacterized protein n=1 Tax=Actinomadura namibiensis TaxID=182080 RepID=A0A7W3LLD6_ACTNM|nr:hypothetical protein [Actinomadura namibiensis]MBA8950269.1 hypothetical protein [Actinomadura namibiensis]
MRKIVLTCAAAAIAMGVTAPVAEAAPKTKGNWKLTATTPKGVGYVKASGKWEWKKKTKSTRITGTVRNTLVPDPNAAWVVFHLDSPKGKPWKKSRSSHGPAAKIDYTFKDPKGTRKVYAKKCITLTLEDKPFQKIVCSKLVRIK